MKYTVNKAISVSSILNIIVLVPVISVILLNIVQVERVWGVNQPSRQILVSLYLALLVATVGIYFLKGKTKMIIAVTIFSLQIIYKTLTAFLVVNSLSNPVVLSNLAINVVHISTLYIVFKSHPDLLK
jgi:hypothetical protein